MRQFSLAASSNYLDSLKGIETDKEVGKENKDINEKEIPDDASQNLTEPSAWLQPKPFLI